VKLGGKGDRLFGGVGERKGVPPEKAQVSEDDPDAERKPSLQVIDLMKQSPSFLRLMVSPPLVITFWFSLSLPRRLGSAGDDQHASRRFAF
jgi:hypothetical protein